MVKIHEHQYVLDNISNRQERDIEYHSWSKYVDDILNSPRRQDLAYPSLPCNSKVNKVIEMTNDKLVIRFYHFMARQAVEHVATLLSVRGNENHKDCNICIAEEDAWQRIKCYIDCHNYDWTLERIRRDYQKYYMKGSYCSHTLMDIIEHHKQECELLFGGER